jgi:hypothetical protein
MKDNHEDLKNQMYNLGVQLRTLSYETQKLDASASLLEESAIGTRMAIYSLQAKIQELCEEEV